MQSAAFFASGKGQLSAAMSQLGELVTDEGVTVIGLAKRLEEVFVPGRGARMGNG